MAVQLVSEQELATTYGPEGWEKVTDYRQAQRLRAENPNMARAEIARRVGRPASGLRSWLVEGKTPPPVKCIQTAREYGWFQPDVESERFRAINQLVAWVFSGGGISEDTFVPTFSVDDELALSTIDRLITWLGIPYRIREYDEPDRAVDVIPAEEASTLGRVLTAIGVPCGIKATQPNISLPSYLTDVAVRHRQDFLRVHLLNRGNWTDATGGLGTYIHSPSSESYRRSIEELIESTTTGSATQGSQDRVWASADAVRDLAGGTPVRPALATQIAYGTMTPPTERALASTYQPTKHSSGMRYLRLYRQAMESDPPALPESAADELSQVTVDNWDRGHTPDVYTAVTTAHDRGWLSIPPESDVVRGLTTLLAWVFTRGTLRSNSYHPVFRSGDARDRPLFESVMKQLDLSYATQRADDPTRNMEFHIDDQGTLIGRLLFVLGAPLGAKRDQPRVPPAYLFQHGALARQFIKIWCYHRGSAESTLELTVPSVLGEQFPEGLAALIETHLSWPTELIDRGLRIPEQSALEQYDSWLDEIEALSTAE